MLVHPDQGGWGGVPLVGAGGVHTVHQGGACGACSVEGETHLFFNTATKCVSVAVLLLLRLGVVAQLLPVQDQSRVSSHTEGRQGFLCWG